MVLSPCHLACCIYMPVYSLLAFRSTWGQLLDTANPVSNLLSHHGRSGWHEESYLLLKLHSTIHAAFLLLALQVDMRTFTCQCYAKIPFVFSLLGIASQHEDIYLPVPRGHTSFSRCMHRKSRWGRLLTSAMQHTPSLPLLACKSTWGQLLANARWGGVPLVPLAVTAGTGSGSQHDAMRTFTYQCRACSIPLLSHYWHASRHEDSYLPMPGGGECPLSPYDCRHWKWKSAWAH